jgi:hypothetical protein
MKRYAIGVALAVAYGLSLVVYSHFRIVDGDEGFYSTAAGLVSEGKIPYRDFFYPQAPLLPFVYAPVVSAGGAHLLSLRYLSLLFAVATVILWSRYLLKKHTESPMAVYATIVVLALNPFFVSWGSTVKTYALANLFATIALTTVWQFSESGRKRWIAVAGAASGLLISTRLLYATFPVVILGWLLLRTIRTSERVVLSEAVSFLIGMLAACIPAMVLFLEGPDVFAFNNVQYHLLRGDAASGLVQGSYSLKFLIDLLLDHPLITLQVFVAGAGILFLLKDRESHPRGTGEFAILSTLIVLAFVITSLAPSPVYEQYFTSPLAPLLVPLMGTGFDSLWRKSRLLFSVSTICMIGLSAQEFNREASEASLAGGWKQESYVAVADWMRTRTTEMDTVLSLWPGYVFESGRRHMPGMENQFALLAAAKLTPQDRQRYRIIGPDDVIGAVQRGQPRLVVVGAWVTFFFRDLGEDRSRAFFHALRQNYILGEEIGGVDIYERAALPER